MYVLHNRPGGLQLHPLTLPLDTSVRLRGCVCLVGEGEGGSK